VLSAHKGNSCLENEILFEKQRQPSFTKKKYLNTERPKMEVKLCRVIGMELLTAGKLLPKYKWKRLSLRKHHLKIQSIRLRDEIIRVSYVKL
jgi:hypothetical protein